MAARTKQRLTKRVAHVAAVIVFGLAQLATMAHAFEHADEADHDQHSCQICHLAKRDGDALPLVQFSCVASADIAIWSNALANDVDSEKIVRSADSRAPPLRLNEKQIAL